MHTRTHTRHTQSKFGFMLQLLSLKLSFLLPKSHILNGVLLGLIAVILVDHSKI